MIACDTSVLIVYFENGRGTDVEQVDQALDTGELAVPPVVITEIVSDRSAAAALKFGLFNIDPLPILEGYWRRAGDARAKLRRAGLRARTADALIAQSCIDHDVALITRDADFRHFAKHCGLRLA
ncbi:MAG: PIN domain-containing protein [Micropepsaceae bacterium]